MQIILSTGNIVSGGPTLIRKPGTFRSNLELTSSLRSAFAAAKQDYAAPPSLPNHRNPPPPDEDAVALVTGAAAATAASSSSSLSSTASAAEALATPTSLHAWTERTRGCGHGHGLKNRARKGSSSGTTAPYTSTDPDADATEETDTDTDTDTLYVPRIDWSSEACPPPLQEPRTAYDLTVKLFFLPLAFVADRPRHAREALALVKKRLGLSQVDLLILSFPDVSFEGDSDVAADRRNAQQGNLDDEVATWRALEELHTSGEVAALGLAEFGSEKLARFLERVVIKPKVDQINVRDCCKVPSALKNLGASAGIELLVHNDCNDILPSGTLRELLGHGKQGAGVLADPAAARGDAAVDAGSDAIVGVGSTPRRGSVTTTAGLRGDMTPLWVVKYTLFVKDRGVVENKGYFAAATLAEE